jgi:2-iminobutanoate/2-iminopropanoate deaminase
MIRPVKTNRAPAPIGHYNQALQVKNLLFTSGQFPIDPTTGALVSGDHYALARRALENLDEVLQAAGTIREYVLRCNIYLTSHMLYQEVNAALADFFGSKHLPSLTTVVAKHLPMGTSIEIDAIAWIPDAEEQKRMPLDG